MIILLVGIVIGVVLGLTGAGGSVVAVPLLILFAGLPATDAVGIALLAVAVSAGLGAVKSWRSDAVLKNPAIVLAISGAVFSPIGNVIGSKISSDVLLGAFAILAIIVAIRMWQQAGSNLEASSVVRAGIDSNYRAKAPVCRMNNNFEFEWKPKCVGALALGGVAAGLLAGLFGVGGGFLVVPLLVYLTGVSMHQVIGTSLVVITIVSASAFLAYILRTPIENYYALFFATAGATIGMGAGILFSKKIPANVLQKVFATSLVLLSLTLLQGVV